MPVLHNPRYELFSQDVAKGMALCDAYVKAGFRSTGKGAQDNASRLRARPEVAARITELKEAAAELTVVTIHDIGRQLDEDRTLAHETKQPGAAVSASMGKAKVYGLLVDRAEHTGANGGPIQTEDMTDRDAVGRMLFLLARERAKRVETLN